MSTIINLFGGPGTGKTTVASEIFSKLKKQGKSVALVPEYVKEWAWEDRKFGKYDQVYFLGKQIKKESMVYGKVDYVVTDSPLLIAGFYAELVNKLGFVSDAALSFMKLAEQDGHRYVNFWLNRDVPYESKGRFQDEEGAKKIDDLMLIYLSSKDIPLTEPPVKPDDRPDWIISRL